MTAPKPTPEQERALAVHAEPFGPLEPGQKPQRTAKDGTMVYPWGDDGTQLLIFPSGSTGIYPPEASLPI